MSTEEAAPPLPSCSITHYENGSGPDIMVSPPPQEKPRRNGTRPYEARPSVESLLDELEGSVPSPRYTENWFGLHVVPPHLKCCCCCSDLEKALILDSKKSTLSRSETILT